VHDGLLFESKTHADPTLLHEDAALHVVVAQVGPVEFEKQLQK